MTLTNETQTIDADALRARLAETPADLRGRIYTAAEAQALLDAREAKGAWRVGGVASEGKVWAHDPTALGGPSVGEVCLFNANLYRPHNGNRALAAAAPGLAAAVIAQSAEIERLRALLAVTQASLEAASSGRRVPVVDEIERLQRERDALRDAAREYLDAEAAREVACDAWLRLDGHEDGAHEDMMIASSDRMTAARTRLAALAGGAP